MNLYQTYQQNFATDRSKTLLIDELGNHYSYADAEQQSAKIANYLIECGLQVGDRVTVQVEKSPQMLWLYLATLRSGLVYHPLNMAYTKSELAFFVGNAKPSLVVCDQSRLADFAAIEQTPQLSENEHNKASYQTLSLNADGSGSLIDEVQYCSSEFKTVASQADDMAGLLYSSGTTGQPKGIVLSHKNLYSNAQVIADYWNFSADDWLLHALPIFHVHGLYVAIGCVLMAGASMHWHAKFDVDKVIADLPKCSVMMGVPTFYTRLLNHKDFNQQCCSNMRLFISGSAPLLADTFDEFQQRTGHSILERYGMSETGMLVSNPYDSVRKAGTVGYPLPGVEVRINNMNDAVGDIVVRGDNVFSGYWQLDKKTKQSFTSDGFFITGDQGYFDDEGYLTIVGRAKDMIICGGLNVYPKELELILNEHPLVDESAIIGLPDADFGEVVTALVVVNSEITAATLKDYMRERVANFKVPKQIIIVKELSRNSMGKIQKSKMREQYSQ